MAVGSRGRGNLRGIVGSGLAPRCAPVLDSGIRFCHNEGIRNVLARTDARVLLPTEAACVQVT